MPNIKSAIKRVAVTSKKNLRNRMVKSVMKTQVRKFDKALAADANSAEATLRETYAQIDKTASKGVIHKNTANRKKSRLALRLNKALDKKARA